MNKSLRKARAISVYFSTINKFILSVPFTGVRIYKILRNFSLLFFLFFYKIRRKKGIGCSSIDVELPGRNHSETHNRLATTQRTILEPPFRNSMPTVGTTSPQMTFYHFSIFFFFLSTFCSNLRVSKRKLLRL